MKRKLIRSLNTLMVISLGMLLLHYFFIVGYGLSAKGKKSDVAVVLGSKVELSGKPSERLKARLDVGVILYQAKKISKIIVSGGIGKEGYDESRVMADYLIGEGVDTADIIRDSLGITTFASAQNSRRIMKAHQWQSVVVVSQYFHLLRSKIAFQKMGVPGVSTEGTSTYFEWRDLYSIFREIPGMYYYLVREYE